MTTATLPSVSPQFDDESTASSLTGFAKALAWKFARSEARGIISIEDLICEANYGLTYAASLFDPERGVPFKKYAAMVVCHRLRNLVAKFRRIRSRETCMPRIGRFEEAKAWEPQVPDEVSNVDAMIDAMEFWDRIRESLTPRHYRIIWRHFAEGLSLADIARSDGISRQRVCQLLGKAIRRLKAECDESQFC